MLTRFTRWKPALFVAVALAVGVGIGLFLPSPPAQQAVAQQKPAPPAKHGKGYKPLSPERRAHFRAIDRAKHGDHIQQAAKNLSLPPAFDVRQRSPLPIWDQGPCGSCYLVSTVRTMTDAGIQAAFGKPDGSFMLSAQYGMDSPRSFGGCDGGNGTEVIAWAEANGWVAEKWVDTAGTAHNDYPAYEARSGRDRTAPGAKVWAKGWTWGLVNNQGNPTTEEMKAAMFLHGRLNISLDAGGQFGNGTSTITQLGQNIDHEIGMVAWDDNKDGGAFLLENQWGEGWGQNGCRWVTYGAARNIVDPFYVSAGVVPPPPPPPGPGPGPTPGPVKTAVLTFADGTSQTLTAGSPARFPVSINMNDGSVVPIPQAQQPAAKSAPKPIPKTAPKKQAAPKTQPRASAGMMRYTPVAFDPTCKDGSCDTGVVGIYRRR